MNRLKASRTMSRLSPVDLPVIGERNLFVELSKLYNQVASWHDVVDGLLSLALSHLHADCGWFSLYDEHTDSYRIEHLKGISPEIIDGINTVCTVGSTCGGTLIINDIRDHFSQEADGFPSSLICYPFYSDQQFIGSIFLCKQGAHPFAQDDQRNLEALCFYCEKLVENAILFKNLTRTRDAMDQLIDKIHMLEKMKSHLSKFVPHSVLRLIEECPDDPQFIKSERNVSVLFLDIVGYTTMNQDYEPQYVNYLVETYFSSFLDDIYRNHGDINETSGDGLMILFMDDDQQCNASQAASTAVSIQNKVRHIQAGFHQKKHDVRVNIGIHTGVALVGSVRFSGSTGDRWTYTASGMTTNISSRIASCGEPGSIVVSDYTANLLGEQYRIEKLGRRRLKNVKDPLLLYNIIP